MLPRPWPGGVHGPRGRRRTGGSTALTAGRATTRRPWTRRPVTRGYGSGRGFTTRGRTGRPSATPYHRGPRSCAIPGTRGASGTVRSVSLRGTRYGAMRTRTRGGTTGRTAERPAGRGSERGAYTRATGRTRPGPGPGTTLATRARCTGPTSRYKRTATTGGATKGIPRTGRGRWHSLGGARTRGAATGHRWTGAGGANTSSTKKNNGTTPATRPPRTRPTPTARGAGTTNKDPSFEGPPTTSGGALSESDGRPRGSWRRGRRASGLDFGRAPSPSSGSTRAGRSTTSARTGTRPGR